MQQRLRYLLLIAIFYLPTAGFAQQANFCNEFGFRSDNDAYLATGQDRYYTNGLFITFRHAMKQQPDNSAKKKIWEAEAGQKMYNAQSGYVSGISYVDRPFAAYLYAGGAINYLQKKQAIRIGLQAGTIGPAALGKEAQELLHQLVGFYAINGWQYQVNNEFGVNTSLLWLKRLTGDPGSMADISFEGSLNAGTTFSDAGAGAIVRFGAINTMNESALTNSRIGSNRDSLPHRELFFFLKPGLSYIAYDATVQGGLFSGSKGPVTYGVKPVVFSQEIGLTFAAKRWTADFSLTFLTRQVESAAKAHKFGTVNLYYRFN